MALAEASGGSSAWASRAIHLTVHTTLHRIGGERLHVTSCHELRRVWRSGCTTAHSACAACPLRHVHDDGTTYAPRWGCSVGISGQESCAMVQPGVLRTWPSEGNSVAPSPSPHLPKTKALPPAPLSSARRSCAGSQGGRPSRGRVAAIPGDRSLALPQLREGQGLKDACCPRESPEEGGGDYPLPPNTLALNMPERHSHTPTPASTAFATASNRTLTAVTVPCTRSVAAPELPPQSPSPSYKSLVRPPSYPHQPPTHIEPPPPHSLGTPGPTIQKPESSGADTGTRAAHRARERWPPFLPDLSSAPALNWRGWTANHRLVSGRRSTLHRLL